MSEWLHKRATAGTTLFVQGPSGQCFYVAGTPE